MILMYLWDTYFSSDLIVRKSIVALKTYYCIFGILFLPKESAEKYTKV